MLFDQFICFWRSTPTKRKYLSFRTIFRSLYFITSSACNTFALPSVKTLLERFLLPVYSRKHGANNLPKLRAASRFVSQIYQIQWIQRTNKTNLLEINTHFFKHPLISWGSWVTSMHCDGLFRFGGFPGFYSCQTQGKNMAASELGTMCCWFQRHHKTIFMKHEIRPRLQTGLQCKPGSPRVILPIIMLWGISSKLGHCRSLKDDSWILMLSFLLFSRCTYVPNLYDNGFSFSPSILCNTGVNIRQASLSSSLETRRSFITPGDPRLCISWRGLIGQKDG